MQLSIQINGTSVSGFLYIYQDNGQNRIRAPFTGTLTGGTLTGAAGDPTQGSMTFSITRTAGPAVPSVASFTANPSTIAPGSASVLSWVTSDATAVTIDNGVGSQSVLGSVTVHPAATTTYTLTATGQGGSVTAKTTVTVTAVAPPPNVVVTALPQGMLQAIGSPLPSDRFTLTNFGGTATNVTFAKSDAFFTVSTSSFSLGPNSSQVVIINATAQAAGNYASSLNVSGNGVAGGLSIPIRLLVAAAPGAPVTVTSPVVRSDVSGPEGSEPNGSVSFTNHGSSEIDGFVVVDVPWIIVSNPTLSIRAAQTEDVHFTIDRAQRPDGNAPIGGVIGSLSFRYINGGSGKTTTLGTTVPSTVTISIVDVVTPNAAPGAPPPLAQGEVAAFIPGASSILGAISDLVLSNHGGSTISDMKIYFSAIGGASQVSSIGQFLSDSGISFPGVLQNVFSSPSQTGTLQLRSAQLGNVSIFQTQITTGGGRSYITALPVFRSDRGFATGEGLFLPGVQKSATMSTSLYLQELTGNNATVRIDFVDSSGAQISSRNSDTLAPFGSLELQNVVPPNAATVRVTNTSSGAAKIDGYALVVDASTNDAFTIVQIGPATDPMVCPNFGSASTAGDMFLNLTNASTSPITVTPMMVPLERRRRAVSHSFAGAPSVGPNAVTIPASGYQQLRLTYVGAMRLTGSTSVRASARFSVTGGGGSFGTGIPVFPTSRALALNDSKRFAGIEDASSNTVAAGRPLTYRTNLLLAETSGQNVTVRLTLRFVFSAGVKVSAIATTSRDIDIPAGSSVVLNDLAQSIVGPQRTNFGDLHNAILDIEVVDGSGSVMPFLQMIDNATGEVTVRQE